MEAEQEQANEENIPKAPLEQDIIYASETNSANKLLGDLICLHRALEGNDSFEPKNVVELMKRGIPVTMAKPTEEAKGNDPAALNHSMGPALMQGPTNFWRKEGQKWTIMSDEESMKYVSAIADAQTHTQQRPMDLTGIVEPDATDVNPILPTDEDIKFTPGEPAPNIFVAHIEAAVINEKDVTYLSNNENRVRVALDALRRCQTYKKPTRFLLQDADDKEKYVVLNKAQCAELVLVHVFEKMRDQFPIVSALANVPIVPTGDVTLPEDYSKPSTSPVDAPSRYDVLFGRGGMTNNHPGNRRFRDIISLHRPDYVRAIKIEKPNVARRIVAAIRTGTPPGRFLKRNPKDLKWYDVGNRHATEKTSQALREKTNAEKNGKVSSEGDVRKRLLEQALYEARMTRMRLSKEGATLPAAYVEGTPAVPMGGVAVAGGIPSATYLPISPSPVVKGDGLGVGASGGSKGSGKKSGSIRIAAPIGYEANLSPDELEKIQRQKQELANLAALNDKEDPPSNDRGAKDPDGNIMVTENDILCGRGGLTNHHKGNKRFRDIVTLHRADYVRAPKVHKPAVARLIVRAIRNSDPPGRFLKKDDKTGKWFDIGDKRASEKASQALREKTPEERVRLKVDAVTAVPLSSGYQNTSSGTTTMLMVPPVGAGLPTIQQVPNEQIAAGTGGSAMIVPKISADNMNTNGAMTTAPVPTTTTKEVVETAAAAAVEAAMVVAASAVEPPAPQQPVVAPPIEQPKAEVAMSELQPTGEAVAQEPEPTGEGLTVEAAAAAAALEIEITKDIAEATAGEVEGGKEETAQVEIPPVAAAPKGEEAANSEAPNGEEAANGEAPNGEINDNKRPPDEVTPEVDATEEEPPAKKVKIEEM
mmetsp:Transcript_17426/g.25769  ORF Transcript_17426/g.25769 Transcript_17426/m.25769 type:complete len:874 (-) Transcript_17426:249-2870(-)